MTSRVQTPGETEDPIHTREDFVSYSAAAAKGPKAVIDDLRNGFALSAVWRAFAWDEIQHRYRRSKLGLAWIIVSYLIYVVAISIFFGGFAALDSRAFIFYVAVGYATFTFLVGNITDGCDVFRNAAPWIKSAPLPYSIYIYKSVARSLFPFVVNMVTAFLFMALMGWRPSWSIFGAIPAIVVFLVNAVWIQMLFGLFSARWRDVAHLMSAITRVLFFTTPIMWVYEERGGLVKRIADLNPLTHFLSVFRTPILDTPMPFYSWPIVIFWTVAGWALAIGAASVMRRRLPFWV